jgi:hypothetical protein
MVRRRRGGVKKVKSQRSKVKVQNAKGRSENRGFQIADCK